MFKTEAVLLQAQGLQGYDLVAQRAAQLRHALSALVPWVRATGDWHKLACICETARSAGQVLRLAHRVRKYEFLRWADEDLRNTKEPHDPFTILPEVELEGVVPVGDLLAGMDVLESYFAIFRRGLPPVLLGVKGTRILYAYAAQAAIAALPAAANSNAVGA